jgi:hypothetical protein
MTAEQSKEADMEAARRDFLEHQTALYERGSRKLVVLGVYVGLVGVGTAVVGTIVGLVASVWWVCWCGVAAFVLAMLAVLAGLAGFVRSANEAVLSMWTPVQHVDEGGAVQIKRMGDGYFALLSAGIVSLNIYVTPEVGDLARTVEVGSFGLNNAETRLRMSRNERRLDDERLLSELRKLVGFPKSADEVRTSVGKLPPSIG